MENFILKIAEIFEVSKVEMTDQITSFDNWDSLASLSLIALVDEEFGVSVSADELIESQTIGGLIKLVESKR